MTTFCGYDAYVYWLDNSASAYNTQIAGTPAIYRIAGNINTNLVLDYERIKHYGLGNRTRTYKNVIKITGPVVIDAVLAENNATGDNWDLAKMVMDTDGTTPSQCLLLIHVDVNRDASRDAGTDFFFYTWGAVMNEVTISSKNNDINRLKYTFDAPNWTIGTALPAGAGGAITGYTDPSGSASPWTEGSWVKAATWQDGGSTVSHAESFDITIRNNIIPRFGYTNKYARRVEKQALDITGNLSVDFQDLAEITELTAEEDANTTTVTVATGETAVITNMNYDTVGIDFGEAAPVIQKIPWTADSVVLA